MVSEVGKPEERELTPAPPEYTGGGSVSVGRGGEQDGQPDTGLAKGRKGYTTSSTSFELEPGRSGATSSSSRSPSPCSSIPSSPSLASTCPLSSKVDGNTVHQAIVPVPDGSDGPHPDISSPGKIPLDGDGQERDESARRGSLIPLSSMISSPRPSSPDNNAASDRDLYMVPATPPSASSHSGPYSRFFPSSSGFSPTEAEPSPRAQRIRLGLTGHNETSATPAIGTDPLYALRLSMTQGSGFYMPTEEQARIRGDEVGHEQNQHPSHPFADGHAGQAPQLRHYDRQREGPASHYDEPSFNSSSSSSFYLPDSRQPRTNWPERPHPDDSGYFPSSLSFSHSLSSSAAATSASSPEVQMNAPYEAVRHARQGSRALDSDDEDRGKQNGQITRGSSRAMHERQRDAVVDGDGDDGDNIEAYDLSAPHVNFSSHRSRQASRAVTLGTGMPAQVPLVPYSSFLRGAPPHQRGTISSGTHTPYDFGPGSGAATPWERLPGLPSSRSSLAEVTAGDSGRDVRQRHSTASSMRYDTDAYVPSTLPDLSVLWQTLAKLSDSVEALTFEQVSQRREIERHAREIDKQEAELERLRELAFSLSRATGVDTRSPGGSVADRRASMTPTSFDPAQRSSVLARASSLSHLPSSASSAHNSPHSFSAQQGSQPAQSFQQSIAHTLPPLSRSAHSYTGLQTPQLAQSRSLPYPLQSHREHHDEFPTQQFNAPQQQQQQQKAFYGGSAQPPSTQGRPHAQSVSRSSEFAPVLPLSAGSVPLSSTHTRASTTSSSSHPATPGFPASPFHALASASGVVLPDYERSGGQPNYRYLLQDHAAVDYPSIIRLILDRNDQQASIFLQQKLKSCGDPARRSQIIDSILPHSFELITNRFGNFIVSRCLDLGDVHQQLAITNLMRGHISNMSCDTYGSHVVQKALDLVEDFSVVVVAELSRNPKTLVHKSSGHVWSKLLSSPKPAANLYRSLKEIKDWSRIAMDETGSLLCQAILENWPTAEKQAIVKALIRDTAELCGSQWATFVVLHLIEHGRPEERDEIFSILLRAVIPISQDQYGAKAIEKMIKVAGMESMVVRSYVQQICDSAPGRPAVISICQNANGSQIVTLLLTSAPSDLKEMLIEAIRRHGVTLKGSKHGSRIWFVVERARAWRGH